MAIEFVGLSLYAMNVINNFLFDEYTTLKRNPIRDGIIRWRRIWRNILDLITYSGNCVRRFLDSGMGMGLSVCPTRPRLEYLIKYIIYKYTIYIYALCSMILLGRGIF